MPFGLVVGGDICAPAQHTHAVRTFYSTPRNANVAWRRRVVVARHRHIAQNVVVSLYCVCIVNLVQYMLYKSIIVYTRPWLIKTFAFLQDMSTRPPSFSVANPKAQLRYLLIIPIQIGGMKIYFALAPAEPINRYTAHGYYTRHKRVQSVSAGSRML